MASAKRQNQARTALHEAAADADEKAVRMLLASGADPNEKDEAGWTALHFAAQARSFDCAIQLLESGANPNAQDEHGNTPLFRAVFNSQGEGELIRFLLRAGAKPDAKNKQGVSPLDLARSIANYNITSYFEIGE